MSVTATTPSQPPTDRAESFTRAAHFWKGRVALYAILEALGIGQGDAVIVPGYTCVVVPTAVHFAGAESVYADIDPDTYNMTLSHVEAAARSATRPLRAVIVQHTYGIPVDLGPILRWARQRDMWVIEDCCHALGGRYRDVHGGAEGQWLELGQLADAAFYSSQWSKPFTTGLGGWARAGDPALQQKLLDFAAEQCRSPGVVESTVLAIQVAMHKMFFRPSLFWLAQDALRGLSRRGLFVGSSVAEELEMKMPADYAKRMSAWQRWLAASAARRAATNIAHRRQLAEWYDEALQSAGIARLVTPAYADPVLLRYPVRVADKPHVLAEARRRHVELGDWFDHPLHPAGCNVAALGWRDGLCPVGEQAAAEVVNLPMHARIGRREVDRGVEFLQEFAG